MARLTSSRTMCTLVQGVAVFEIHLLSPYEISCILHMRLLTDFGTAVTQSACQHNQPIHPSTRYEPLPDSLPPPSATQPPPPTSSSTKPASLPTYLTTLAPHHTTTPICLLPPNSTLVFSIPTLSTRTPTRTSSAAQATPSNLHTPALRTR